MKALQQGDASLAADRRRQNLKLALILASVSAAFFVGFVLKLAAFGA
jgi:hypothetical protein